MILGPKDCGILGIANWMRMLILTGEWCTKNFDHVWDLVSLHTQCVQRVMKLDILDM